MSLLSSSLSKIRNHIDGVIVGVIGSSAVDHRIQALSVQAKDYKIGNYFLSTKHATLRNKSNDWVARNQDNVSELSDMSAHTLLFHWTRTIKIQLSLLV